MTDKTPPPKKDQEEDDGEDEAAESLAEGSIKGGVVTEQPTSGDPARRKNGCQRCCGKFMDFVVTDAIYGSFFGPHPVSFVCICVPCKRCVSHKFVAPFCVASIVTKVMNFIMLGVVSMLAGFFIIPWPKTGLSFESTAISSFYPCNGGKMEWAKAYNGGCEAHAGYFMVYRCFLAFGSEMLTNNVVLSFITSSTEDPHRAKIHRGFWLYKYLYLIGLLFLYFLILNGNHDKDGLFEYVCSLFGNVMYFFFSLITLTFIMDVAELIAAENRNSTSSWKDFLYWLHTVGIFTADIIAFIQICIDFGYRRKFEKGDKWPSNNCEPGEQDGLDVKHSFLILGMIILFGLLIFVHFAKTRFKERYPFSGWLQVSVLIGYNLFCLWSALYSSPNVNSRPRCNWALRNSGRLNVTDALQSGSWDVYYRHTGFLHACLVIFTLMYYAFIHGPRSNTAPLSLAFRHFWGEIPRTPVYPDPEADETPSEFKEKIETLDVWDDEQESLAQSWSKFYLMMALGGFTLMMAMTNFTNPWTTDKYNSSIHALGFKYASGVMGTLTYILFLILPCKAIHPGFEKTEVVKKLRLTIDANNEENVLSTEVVEVKEVEEKVRVEPIRKSSSVVDPKNCGCMH